MNRLKGLFGRNKKKSNPPTSFDANVSHAAVSVQDSAHEGIEDVYRAPSAVYGENTQARLEKMPEPLYMNSDIDIRNEVVAPQPEPQYDPATTVREYESVPTSVSDEKPDSDAVSNGTTSTGESDSVQWSDDEEDDNEEGEQDKPPTLNISGGTGELSAESIYDLAKTTDEDVGPTYARADTSSSPPAPSSTPSRTGSLQSRSSAVGNSAIDLMHGHFEEVRQAYAELGAAIDARQQNLQPQAEHPIMPVAPPPIYEAVVEAELTSAPSSAVVPISPAPPEPPLPRRTLRPAPPPPPPFLTDPQPAPAPTTPETVAQKQYRQRLFVMREAYRINKEYPLVGRIQSSPPTAEIFATEEKEFIKNRFNLIPKVVYDVRDNSKKYTKHREEFGEGSFQIRENVARVGSKEVKIPHVDTPLLGLDREHVKRVGPGETPIVGVSQQNLKRSYEKIAQGEDSAGILHTHVEGSKTHRGSAEQEARNKGLVKIGIVTAVAGEMFDLATKIRLGMPVPMPLTVTFTIAGKLAENPANKAIIEATLKEECEKFKTIFSKAYPAPNPYHQLSVSATINGTAVDFTPPAAAPTVSPAHPHP